MANPGIASLVKSQAWQEIVVMFKEEMGASLSSIPTTQDDREIATQYIGRTEANNIINKVFKRIDKEADETVIPPKQSFK